MCRRTEGRKDGRTEGRNDAGAPARSDRPTERPRVSRFGSATPSLSFRPSVLPPFRLSVLCLLCLLSLLAAPLPARERRLVDIYKRGPLYTFQALMAAESFGDLLSRYKYLYLTSRQDRALVTDVEQLRSRVVSERNTILDVRGQLDRSRQEREAEYAKYTELARARERRLPPPQPSARKPGR